MLTPDVTIENQLFTQARTHSHWQERLVDPSLLTQLYELLKMAPTSANCSPARFVFVTTQAAKEKLRPCLDAGNIEKTMRAPVTVIIGMDRAFYERLPELFPHADARAWFVGQAEKIQETAMRNSSLQGAYLIIAARLLCLDCGPMSGFNRDAVDAAFFAETSVTTNFLCNLGYGVPEKLYPRSPRLSFDDACRIL
ncbi:MAG: malonic semialdehyde reductase [Rickettsiales bacterium]|nr:malonic semialdehyde reductase [Rickettsiales bacterium]